MIVEYHVRKCPRTEPNSKFLDFRPVESVNDGPDRKSQSKTFVQLKWIFYSTPDFQI